MTEEFNPKQIQDGFGMTLEEVAKTLKEFEELGIVWKRWDVRKNDYIWYKTELGHDVAKKMGME